MMVKTMFRAACRLHTQHAVNRYLMSCAHGRWDGAEKALRHRELCSFYVAVARGLADPDHARRCHEKDYKAVHRATQALTDHLDEAIGFPLDSMPDYDALAEKFFARFHDIAIATLRAATGGKAGEPARSPAGSGEAG